MGQARLSFPPAEVEAPAERPSHEGSREPEQVELFPPPPPTAEERSDALIAEGRAKYFERSFSREQRRSRRKREVRARTVSVKRMTKTELELGRLLYPEDENAPPRPKTREDCANVPRPCPYVSCKHHLYLDVSRRTGAIKLNFPDLEVWEMPPSASCSLDIADRKGATLEQVGEILNLTRERVRQIEVKGLANMKANGGRGIDILREYHGEGGPVGKRRLPVIQPDDDENEEDAVIDDEDREDFDAERFSSIELDAD